MTNVELPEGVIHSERPLTEAEADALRSAFLRAHAEGKPLVLPSGITYTRLGAPRYRRGGQRPAVTGSEIAAVFVGTGFAIMLAIIAWELVIVWWWR